MSQVIRFNIDELRGLKKALFYDKFKSIHKKKALRKIVRAINREKNETC